MSHANFVFSRAELFRFERILMEMLKFHISLPTRLQFAEYLGKMQKTSKRQGILLQYLVGLSMLDFDLNYYKNSVVAAAALVVTFQVPFVCILLLIIITNTLSKRFFSLVAAHESLSRHGVVHPSRQSNHRLWCRRHPHLCRAHSVHAFHRTDRPGNPSHRAASLHETHPSLQQ